MAKSSDRVRPRRRLSQNFLADPTIARRIVATFAPAPHDRVVEVGAGRGALTAELAGKVTRLVAIELDRRLIGGLAQLAAQRPGVEVLAEDILGVELAALRAAGDPPWRVIGNLPYAISTPILRRLIGELDDVADALFMVQLEFAERLAAVPGTKSYGSLTVFVQSFFSVTPLFTVSPRAFRPRPAVRSQLVGLRPLARGARFGRERAPALKRLLQAAFSARRKTLTNGLSRALGLSREETVETLRSHGVAADARAETVPVAAWQALTRSLEHTLTR